MQTFLNGFQLSHLVNLFFIYLCVAYLSANRLVTLVSRQREICGDGALEKALGNCTNFNEKKRNHTKLWYKNSAIFQFQFGKSICDFL